MFTKTQSISFLSSAVDHHAMRSGVGDPTNKALADERYVIVAVGRDYDDVAPVVGNYRGTAHCRLEVCVEVEKL